MCLVETAEQLVAFGPSGLRSRLGHSALRSPRLLGFTRTASALRAIYHPLFIAFLSLFLFLECISAKRQFGFYTCLGNIWKVEPLRCDMTDDCCREEGENKPVTLSANVSYVLSGVTIQISTRIIIRASYVSCQ